MTSPSQPFTFVGSTQIIPQLRAPMLQNNLIDDVSALHTTPDLETGMISSGYGIKRLFNDHQSPAPGTTDGTGSVLPLSQGFLR
ncbi:MAG: hypothetical protein CV089_09060 [Nitrospira sp. WS110]|nr:hypothetical protein [Nitrospira sp. WS110]